MMSPTSTSSPSSSSSSFSPFTSSSSVADDAYDAEMYGAPPISSCLAPMQRIMAASLPGRSQHQQHHHPSSNVPLHFNLNTASSTSSSTKQGKLPVRVPEAPMTAIDEGEEDEDVTDSDEEEEAENGEPTARGTLLSSFSAYHLPMASIQEMVDTAPLQAEVYPILPSSFEEAAVASRTRSSSTSASSSTSSPSPPLSSQLSEADEWLMLACANRLGVLTVGPTDKQKEEQKKKMKKTRKGTKEDAQKPIQVCGHLQKLAVLVYTLAARVDARMDDAQGGYSPIHFLIFEALKQSQGEAKIISKSGDDDAMASASASSASPAQQQQYQQQQQEDEVDLSNVTRYRIEVDSSLSLLLNASRMIDYSHKYAQIDDVGASILHSEGELVGRGSSDGSSESSMGNMSDGENEEREPVPKGSILDLQDALGNTVLHYSVAHQRVDIVGLLLRYGASIHITNAQGLTVWDMVQWQPKKQHLSPKLDGSDDMEESKLHEEKPSDTTAADGAASSSSFDTSNIQVHPLISHFDTSIHTCHDNLLARKWGLNEGLRFESCSYEGESEEGAIKRLLFQQRLFEAVDVDPEGDMEEVKSLVKMWQQEYESGESEMYPLAYRADSFFISPLQTASSYESSDTAILSVLLKLPFLLHLQSACKDFACLTKALMSENTTAAKMLIQAGYNINALDTANQSSALHTLCSSISDHKSEAKLNAYEEELIATVIQLHQKYGANPLACDEFGNNSLTACIYSGRLNMLKYFQSQFSKEQIGLWLNSTNFYGCSPSHYLLYSELPITHQDQQMLAFMLSIGARFDSPQNHAGLTPLAAYTGLRSKAMNAMANKMKVKIDEWKQTLQAHYRKPLLQWTLIESDISRGAESSPIRIISSFEITEVDRQLLRDFTYITQHRATDKDETKEFIEAHHRQQQQEDDEKENCAKASGTTLQATIFRFIRQPVVLIPSSSFEIRMTREKGFGLFATQPIELEHGIEVVGEVLTQFKSNRRSREYLQRGECFILPRYRIHDRINIYSIDNRHFGNVTRFINHSCQPNFTAYLTHSGRQLILYPMRAIKVGEEITIRYEYSTACGPTVRCECGEKKCTGQVT